jgi:hypothetical protein
MATFAHANLRGNGGAEMLGLSARIESGDASSETFALLTCCWYLTARRV